MFARALLVTALATSATCSAEVTARSTVAALNVMQQLMTGDAEYFDPAHLAELGQCWDDTHPDLRQGRR